MWSPPSQGGKGPPSMSGVHWTGLREHPTPRRGERIEQIAVRSLAELRVGAGKAHTKDHPDQVIVGVGFGGGAAIAFLGVPVKEPQAGSAAFGIGICSRPPKIFRKVQAQSRAPIEAVVRHCIRKAAVAVSPRRSVEPDVGPIPALVGDRPVGVVSVVGCSREFREILGTTIGEPAVVLEYLTVEAHTCIEPAT